jgi:uncharacterized protein with HEPN domain
VTAASPSKVSRYLSHIIESVDRILAYVKGMDEEAFACDAKTQDAVERCLERLTEALDRINKKKAEHLLPGVEWHSYQALGSRLRHQYDNIRVSKIWATIQNDLGPLRQQCAQALENLKVQDPGAS